MIKPGTRVAIVTALGTTLVAAGAALTSSVVDTASDLQTLQATTVARLARIEEDVKHIRSVVDQIHPRVNVPRP